jgi:hypothetical protein
VLLLVATALANQPVWVDPIEVHGAWFPDEVEAIRAAIRERLEREPGITVVDGSDWERVAREGRTLPDGPVCAEAPRLESLVERRTGAPGVRPLLDDRELSFTVEGARYAVALETWDLGVWKKEIANVVGLDEGSGGGGRGIGLVGDAIGLHLDVHGDWREPAALSLKAVSASLTPCQDTSAGRNRERAIETTWVLAVAPDGTVSRIGAQEPVSGDSIECLSKTMKKLSFPASDGGARRAVMHVVDRALEPVEDAGRGQLRNVTLDGDPGGLETGPFYDQRPTRRCALPAGEWPFTLDVDALGNVTRADITGLDGAPERCVEDGLRTLRFPCPDGGPVQVQGRYDVRSY